MLPGETIGILGGGQLGRMIAIEAKKMGYSVICLDPTPNSPCGQVADDQIVAGFNDLEAAIRLAERSALVLYEFENIDAGVVRELEKRYRLPQKSRILSITQNRFLEKTELHRTGFPVAPFKVIRNEGELSQAVEELGFPCMLKVSRGGYDGKGQLAIHGPGALPAALEQVQSSNQEWVLEKMISFTHECSAIVARNRAGATTVFPVAENIHRDNILFMSIVPARIPPEMETAAEEAALEIAKALDIVGLLAVEFFLTAEGLLVNELAPRPHNSGHYTFDACYTSQFEQLIRALCGLPFGSPDLLTPVVMVNILGKHLAQVLQEIPHLPPDTKLHLYGKRGDASPNRKMGHLTIRAEFPDEVVHWANKFFI
ncbi:MAG: 5-(carboxyamino)imidazole ribonucleotide synthase [Bacillota bacterium]